ncbi:MAG: AAA family ATPase [Nitrospira sp.]|nr:AAA family ATPase [Nitrospira sp.]
MLERIEEIQSIGLLHTANGKPYKYFKATLIYADNGRGKSTLATVLRSLSTGDPSLILSRKTVDGTQPPKAVLQFANGQKVTFSGNAWSEQRPELVVFDSDFIERNVHSGSVINTGHRKNLLEFALGEPAVAARAAVDQATAAAKTATDKVQEIIGQLSGYHSGLSLFEFEKLPSTPDADGQIAALQKRLIAAGNTAAIIAKPVPKQVSEPTFDFETLFKELRRSLINVHADAEQVVKQHLQKIGRNGAEDWLSQGQQYEGDNTCPYCGQGTKDNDLIRAYQTHFNAAYAALKKDIADLHDTLVTDTKATIIDTFSQGIATAMAQAAAWSEQVQTKPIALVDAPARLALAELQNLVLDLVKRKQASPAEPVGTASDLEKARSLWQQVLTPMQSANEAVKDATALITAYQGQLATDSTQLLEQQIKQIETCKRRHDSVVVGLFGQLATLRANAATAESTKKTERDKLDALMATTLQQYEKTINNLLKNFGASFSIKGMTANFRGAGPRTEYGLVLRGKHVALEGGPPSFSTTLSEGDKRTLAFAFFIASTFADAKLSTKIVVIDDPMCSLDLNRKHHTRSVLKNLHSKAEQLIVLAHDPYFIRDLRDAICRDDPAAPITTLQLSLAGNNYTDFSSFDVDKECESAYFQHHRLLNEFTEGRAADSRIVAKALRPMLEGYLHRRFPGLIPRTLMFGQVVALIRDAPPTSPLAHAKNLVSALNDINEYAGQFHHDVNPSADVINIVASELKTFVDRSLGLVHSGTPLT